MTLSEIQTIISAEFDQAGSTISESSDEYRRRTTIVNIAERTWREYLQGRWTALETEASLSTTTGQSYVNLPTGYKKGRELFDRDQKITIGVTNYPLTTRDRLYKYDTVEPFCWIEGNDAVGYKLYIQPTPSAVTTFPFRYLTKNTATDANGVDKEVMTAATDITKCPDPMFLVDYALGRLFKGDDEMNKGATYSTEALNLKLSQMVKDHAIQRGLIVDSSSELQGFAPIGGTDD